MSIIAPRVKGEDPSSLKQPRDPKGRYDFKMGGDSSLLEKRDTDFPSPFVPPEEMDLDDIAPLPEGTPDPLKEPRVFVSVYDDSNDPWAPDGNRFLPDHPATPHRPQVDTHTAVLVAGEAQFPVSTATGPDGREDQQWAVGGDVGLHNHLVECGIPFRPATNVGHKVDGAAYVNDTNGESWLLMRNLHNPGAYTLDNFRSRGSDGEIIPFSSRQELIRFLSDTPNGEAPCQCPGDTCFC